MEDFGPRPQGSVVGFPMESPLLRSCVSDVQAALAVKPETTPKKEFQEAKSEGTVKQEAVISPVPWLFRS